MLQVELEKPAAGPRYRQFCLNMQPTTSQVWLGYVPKSCAFLQILGFFKSLVSWSLLRAWHPPDPPGCSSGCFQSPHWNNRMGRLWNSSSVKVELASCDKLVDKNPAPTPSTNLPWKIHLCKIIYSTNLHPLCRTWTWLLFHMDGDTWCWNTQVAPHFLPKKRHQFFSPLTSPKGSWIATFHCAWHFGLWRLWFRIGGTPKWCLILFNIVWYNSMGFNGHSMVCTVMDNPKLSDMDDK